MDSLVLGLLLTHYTVYWVSFLSLPPPSLTEQAGAVEGKNFSFTGSYWLCKEDSEN